MSRLAGFSFRTSPEVHFGRGESARSGAHAARFGRRILLVTGTASLERSGMLGQVEEGLRQAGVSHVRWTVGCEPDVPLVDRGAALCRQEGCDAVLAVGGGSVLDAAKAVAALATNPGSALAYLEDVPGVAMRPLEHAPLPIVAVPTTAGTGSEVTRNGVLKVPEARLKRSLRDDRLVPQVAVVDPDLLAGAPLPVAAASGMDALTHLLEAYLCTRANPMTDALALQGIKLVVPALRRLADGPPDADTREALALASLWGGMALANAGLGAVHGLVAPLGGLSPIPHGVGCADLLPACFAANVAALREREPGHPVLPRFAEVAAVVSGGDPRPERAAEELEQLRRRLQIPPVRAYGVTEADIPAVLAGARGSSMRTNPIVLTDDELVAVMHRVMADR